MDSKRLVRTAGFDFDLKRSEADAGVNVLSGKLAVFNDWTEIKSPVERPYHFVERIARGAFSKTIQENGQRLKVLFQHGQDAAIGKKPLGRILRLEETNAGVEYDVELLDAPTSTICSQAWKQGCTEARSWPTTSRATSRSLPAARTTTRRSFPRSPASNYGCMSSGR